MNRRDENIAQKLETTLEETWLRELKQKSDNMRWRKTHDKKDPNIFRVPNNIRATDPAAYSPKFISLGPFHHQRLHELGDQKLKWFYLNSFLSRNERVGMEEYLKLIKEQELRARNAYSEHVDMESNEFAEMMLLDCCFVLEFMLLQYEESELKRRSKEAESKRDQARAPSARQHQRSEPVIPPVLPRVTTTTSTTTTKKKTETEEMTTTTTTTTTAAAALLAQSAAGRCSFENDPLKRTQKWALPLILHDLLMLENQLPLFLLRSLYQIARVTPSLDELMQTIFERFPLFTKESIVKEGHHLLHLFHSCIVPSPNLETTHQGNCENYLIPCARELREARMRFVKKDKKKKDKKIRFTDITFESARLLDIGSFWSSRLEIPEICIEDGTNTLLRNLIAFEQCCPATKVHVSAYAFFMDQLIDTNEDVALLRQKGIMVNGLGSDKEVALLFNQLCKEVTVDPDNCYLWPVIDGVHEHLKGCNSCWGSLKHTYFRNPWAIISVAAAIILFVLTFLQTLYTILGYDQS